MERASRLVVENGRLFSSPVVAWVLGAGVLVGGLLAIGLTGHVEMCINYGGWLALLVGLIVLLVGGMVVTACVRQIWLRHLWGPGTAYAGRASVHGSWDGPNLRLERNAFIYFDRDGLRIAKRIHRRSELEIDISWADVRELSLEWRTPIVATFEMDTVSQGVVPITLVAVTDVVRHLRTVTS